MLITPHALIGIYLATKFSPAIGLPAAFLSHFLFDFSYPHWNPHLYTEMKKSGKVSQKSLKWISGDTTITSLICLLWAAKTWPNLNLILLAAAGALLAILPDLIEIPYYFLKSKNRLLKKYVTFEHKYQFNVSPLLGTLSQIIIMGACLIILF